MHFKGED